MSGEFKRKDKPVIMLDEVPSDLKELARLVVRGFYTIDDVLIIDMLVRNPCMKEDDIAELLLFEKKQLRARLAILRNDKFVQERLKMETGPDGKAQKVNYYFIHYKRFVNVVKYKLDQVHKRLETEERLATSRASFRCSHCQKTFTDLEADQLFDFETQEFRCTNCFRSVEEDSAALPRKDSRLMLARFNEQMQVMYDILTNAEGIQLSRKVLEPEPVDIDFIRGIVKPNTGPRESLWSGEATRSQGFKVEETHVDILIGDETPDDKNKHVKERPVWMTKSTVENYNALDGDGGGGTEQDQFNGSNDNNNTKHSSSNSNNNNNYNSSNNHNKNKKDSEDIMAVLLQHEKQPLDQQATSSHNKAYSSDSDLEGNKNSISSGFRRNHDNSDSEDDDDKGKQKMLMDNDNNNHEADEDDNSGETIPTVLVNGQQYHITAVDETMVEQMTPQEKENYIQVYQSYYTDLFD